MSDKRIFLIPEIIKDCIMTSVDIRLSYVKFLLSMDAGKGNFCYPWMQERVISAIHGWIEELFLLSMDAGQGSFFYPWMQQREISSIHGCSKGKFLLSMDAGKGNFCYPWMHRRIIVPANHGCRTRKFLLSMDAAKESFCYPLMQERVISAIYVCTKGSFCYLSSAMDSKSIL